MPIDASNHTFVELATKILPTHMQGMREAMQRPVLASVFAEDGVGVKGIAKRLKLPDDFPGCYLFQEDTRAIYVGISRSVLNRIRQHLRGKTHFDASLAYRMAKRKMPTRLQRTEAMEDSAFKAVFEECQTYLRTLQVSFIPIDNDLVIYLFEAYCAMELDTGDWNTFRTH